MSKVAKTLDRVLRGNADANIAFSDLRRIQPTRKIHRKNWRTAVESESKYEIILYWSKEDQAFIAEVPELPGCSADGPTYRDALANVEQIVQEWIETALDLGRPIPQPRGRLQFA